MSYLYHVFAQKSTRFFGPVRAALEAAFFPSCVLAPAHTVEPYAPLPALSRRHEEAAFYWSRPLPEEKGFRGEYFIPKGQVNKSW